jgi:sugar phosphate isomerase/epimerase
MKFGITNLSWKPELDSSIAKDLSQFDYFETVFPRRDSGNYYSTQSIFYGCDIQSFEQKEKTISHLRYVIEECSKYKIKIIVFGSPSLRKGSKIKLLEVFDEIDNELKNKNIILCVEPNSKYYNGEYYFSLDEIVPDIKGYSNIKTMIDSHNLILEGDDIFLTYEKYSDYIKHIHISEKDLKPVKDFDYYKKFISFLRDNSYNLGITYELKQCENIISESHKFMELKE